MRPGFPPSRPLVRFVWLLAAAALAVLVLVACQGNEGGNVVGDQGERTPWDKRAAELGLDRRAVLDQLVAFYASTDWEEGGMEFNAAIFRIDDTAQLVVEVETHELMEPITAEAVMNAIATQSMPEDAAEYEPGRLARQTFPRMGSASDGNKILYWSRAGVSGRYARVAHFMFQMKPGAWETPDAARYVAMVEWIVETATFTPEPTPIDAIAPSTTMKQTSVDEVMRFRVPVGWARSRQKYWTLFDPGDPKLGVFEANWDAWTSNTPAGEMTQPEAMMMFFTVYEKFPELLGATDWAIIQDTNNDKSPPERWVTFRKLYSEMNRVLVLSFQYRVAEALADTPEIRAIDEMFEREVRAAVARFPAAGSGVKNGGAPRS